MVKIGQINTLSVKRLHTLGAFLDGGNNEEVLLPKRYLPADCDKGDQLKVFVYLDTDDQLTATTEHPLAQVGEVAWLKVVAVNKVGAFLDWGLPKDLLVPYSEQSVKMEAGRRYLVMLFVDESNRIAASSKLNDFIHDENAGLFSQGEEVQLMIADRTDLGMKAVINNSHWGVLYQNELFKKLNRGDKLSGYIKKVRSDDRLDLTLQKPGYSKSRMDDLANRVYKEMEKQGGYIALNDKSSPEKIYQVFGVSKKMFKQAIGKLYKQRLITIEEDGVYRTDGDG